ncbi:hypothetical protein [Bosea massiliensis]|uniref:Uncharacterized protein n=1 Tax=Bosea massiliensis TaxID=151419 RepID=A0ABW0PCT2_9HYPH
MTERRDAVVEAVREDLLRRSQVGIAKYGVTLERKDLNLRDWLQHAYEEHLDAANYLKRAILEIDAAPAGPDDNTINRAAVLLKQRVFPQNDVPAAIRQVLEALNTASKEAQHAA